MTLRLALLALLLALQSCLVIPKERMVDVEHAVVTTESGVSYQDVLTGTGDPVSAPGWRLTIDYVCTLEDQTEIDSTYARGQPLTFTLGEAWLPGIDDGVVGMRVGGTRKITVPPAQAYGDEGVEGLVPPGASLLFALELIALEAPE